MMNNSSFIIHHSSFITPSYDAQPCTNNAGMFEPAAAGAMLARDKRHGCGSISVV